MIAVIALDITLDLNNGTAVAANNLINALKDKGHEVRVITSDKKYMGKHGYFVTDTLNFGKIINKYIEKNKVSLAKADNKLISEALDGADVVHVMVPFSIGNNAAKYAKEHNIAITAGFHCQAENITSHLFLKSSKLVNFIIYRVFWKKLYKNVDIIHYPTQFIRDVFEKNIKRTTNGRVISNGVGEDFLCKRIQKPKDFEDKYVILFTGRYSKEKNHKVLIKAVKQSKYSKKIQLIFAGEGPLREKLEKYSKKNLYNQPIFGFHTHEELLNIINYSDLYVHAADIEIEAIACLEAIKCGLVPIINDSPKSAAKYFALDENNLFKCNSAKDLAKKIDYWIENDENKAECSKKYMGFTKQFDRSICMDNMVELLEDAVRMKQ